MPYTVQLGSLTESPKGKLPYIRISEGKDTTGSLLSDSTCITKTLIEGGVIDDLNDDLRPAQKAVDLTIRALLEDKIYFITVRRLLWRNMGIDTETRHVTHTADPL
jgi:hypothetical protein